MSSELGQQDAGDFVTSADWPQDWPFPIIDCLQNLGCPMQPCDINRWFIDRIGDGNCDNGTGKFGFSFACADFEWDNGDCKPPAISLTQQALVVPTVLPTWESETAVKSSNNWLIVCALVIALVAGLYGLWRLLHGKEKMQKWDDDELYYTPSRSESHEKYSRATIRDLFPPADLEPSSEFELSGGSQIYPPIKRFFGEEIEDQGIRIIPPLNPQGALESPRIVITPSSSIRIQRAGLIHKIPTPSSSSPLRISEVPWSSSYYREQKLLMGSVLVSDDEHSRVRVIYTNEAEIGGSALASLSDNDFGSRATGR